MLYPLSYEGNITKTLDRDAFDIIPRDKRQDRIRGNIVGVFVRIYLKKNIKFLQ